MPVSWNAERRRAFHHHAAAAVTACLCSDARSEDQICQCVRKGDRPAEDLIPKEAPGQLIRLMKWSWQQDPQCRPTFKGTALERVPPSRNTLFKKCPIIAGMRDFAG